MIDREQIPIEQLWYTWSEQGLGTIRAGFRIRAASEGLSDIHSERVKGLDRYIRYLLPPGTDHFALTPEQAPRCLTITQTEQNETIIVHKQYTGRDGVGRPGNFFTHLLALGSASPLFSAADAIWLWGSSLWQTSDAGLDQRTTMLNRLSLDQLYAHQHFDPQFASVEPFLPFLIEAYLTRRDACPIYVLTPTSAPAMFATVIAGLVRCLPRPLLAGLSFSTYEPDSSRAMTQLVGLSADLGQAPHAAPVVPASFYQQHLAINCATGEHSSLSRHPLVQSIRQAKQFAREATRSLITNDMDQMDALLDRMESRQDITAERFIRFYAHASGSASDIATKDIEEYISSSECVQWLNNSGFRERVIATAIQDPRWCTARLCPSLSSHLAACAKTWRKSAGTGQPSLRVLLATPQQRTGPKTSARLPRTTKKALAAHNDTELLAALAQLANDAATIIKLTLKKMGTRAEQSGESSSDKSAVITLISLMDACLFSNDIYGIWKALLEEIVANREMLVGLLRNWTLYTALLQRWSRALAATSESDALINPLLRTNWSSLGDFLLLHLNEQHKTWNIIALERLLNNSSSLSVPHAQRLAQIAAPEIQKLLEQLIQEPQHWSLAVSMVTVLARAGYPGPQTYTDRLEKFFEDIFQTPQNWQLARDLLIALTQSGNAGSKSYRHAVCKFLHSLLNTLQSTGLELVEALVKYNYAGKVELVPILLETSLYQNDLARVLTTLYPTDDALATFFVQHGQQYLATPQQVTFMLNLYDRLKAQPERQQRLWLLLNAHLEETTIAQILKTISSDDAELVPTLQRYGATYLQGYQDHPQLAAWVIQTFTDLAAHGYPVKDLLFTLFTQPASPEHLETLLVHSAKQFTLADVRQFLSTYGTDPAYISFCCHSETVLMLLEQYAKQTTLTMQTKRSAQQISEEKMQMLLCWLEPQRVSEMALNYSEIESIFTAAHLQISEQVQFLERYGNYYLRYTQYLPHLQEYVRTYVASLEVEALDQPERYTLFNAICQDPSLDTETRYRLLSWQHVLSFLAHPATDAQTLTELCEALNRLPINEAMMTRLAQASIFCIKEESDFVALAHTIEQVPSLSYAQMLYRIAEQAAIMYNQYRTESPLLPYIIFALTCSLAEQERFVQTFLDTLLYPIAESDLDTWSLLHLLIEAPQAQPVPSQALERWSLYLNRRGLLNKIQKAARKLQGRTGSIRRHLSTTGSLDTESVQENAIGNLWKKLWQRNN